VLDAKSMDEVDFVTAGIDHCSWLLDLKVKGKNGFEILRQKKIVEKAYRNEILATVDDRYAGMEEQRLRFVIWDMLGYLPAIGDLHICEFFPYFFKTEELRKYWSLHYDRLIERPKTIKAAQERAEALLNCQKPLEVEPSGEIVANFISALNGRGEFIEVLNTPNIGQISNLPIGAIVETKCLINSNGVQPISVGTLPALLESIVRPALLCEMMYMEAVYEWDKRKAIAALCIDPVAGDFRYISQMVDEYFALNETVLEKLGIKINSWK
jgi:alpha-galactosidase